MENPGVGQDPGSTRAENFETLPDHSTIGEFEIVGIIGEGGFGTVYLAIDHSLQRRVALKEYRPVSLTMRQGQAVVVRSQRRAQEFEEGLKSFINESRTLARFDHPALIRVYRVWQQNNTAYMAMQLCEGRSLTSLVREHPDLIDQAWLKAMLIPLLEAVETLHSAQIYHRDIAPDNILIQENGAPMLLDFGAARHIATDRTQALTVILKPGYAPIEQYAEDPSLKQGPWTDIYALGAVIHFAITGMPPANSVARLVKDPLVPLAGTRADGYSEDFLRGIDAALAIKPEDRPQSIAELRARLELPVFVPPPRSRIPANTAPTSAATTLTQAVAGPVSRAELRAMRAANTDPQSEIYMPRTATEAPQSPLPAEILPAPSPDGLSDAGHGAPTASPLRPWVLGATAGVVVVAVAAVLLRSVLQSAAPSAPSMDVDFARTAPSGTAPSGPAPLAPPAAESAAKMPPKRPSSGAVPPAGPAVATTAQPKSDGPADGGAVALGTVRLAVTPWGEIFIDGISQGVSPPLKRLALPEGKHVVVVTNPGFPNYSAEIEVAKSRAATVSYTFK